MTHTTHTPYLNSHVTHYTPNITHDIKRQATKQTWTKHDMPTRRSHTARTFNASVWPTSRAGQTDRPRGAQTGECFRELADAQHFFSICVLTLTSTLNCPLEDASSSKWSGSWREQEVASHDGENRWEGGGWHSWGEQADSRRSRSRESRPQRWLESESNRDKGKDSFDKVEGKGNTDGSDVWPRDHRDREFLALTSDTPPISERGSSGRQRTRKGGKGCKGW